jgi:WD40 repeat protein
VATGKELHTTRLSLPSPYNRFVFTPDGRRVLSLSYGFGTRVRLWDLKTGKESTPFEEDWNVHDADFSKDGRFLFAGGPKHAPVYGGGIWGYVVQLIDLPAAKQVRRVESKGVDPEHAVLCVALSPDGKLALTGSNDGVVRLWPLGAE